MTMTIDEQAETPVPFATLLRQQAGKAQLARQLYESRQAWEGDRRPDWYSLPVHAKLAYAMLAGDILEALRSCPSEPRQDQLSQAIFHQHSNTPTLHLVKETHHVPEL